MATSKGVITRPLLVTMATILLGLFQFGYNLGVVTNTQDFVKEFINRTLNDREGSYPSDDSLTNIWAICVAILFLGGCAGVLSNKWIVQYMSRRRGLFLNALFGILTTSILVSSKPTEKWELFLVGRLVCGFHCGIYTGLSSVYMTEVIPNAIRGSLNTLNVLSIFSGVLCAQILGFPVLFGTEDLWAYTYGFAIVTCVTQLILLPFCVESPSYLLTLRKDEVGAKSALQKLRQTNDVEDELEDRREEMKIVETVSLIQLFRHPPYRRATTLGAISQFSLQLTGAPAVFFYVNSLLQDSAGLSKTTAAYTSSTVGVITIVTSIAVIPLAEKAGRRLLHLVGYAGLIFSLVMITVCFALKDDVEAMGNVSIGFVLLYVLFFTLGPAPVPWILLGDLFTQETRPTASSVALIFHWMGAFIVSYIFPPMEKALKAYVFVPFTVYVIVASIYFYFCQPETKGKTIQEVTKMFEKPDDDEGGVFQNRKPLREKNSEAFKGIALTSTTIPTAV